MPVALHRSQKMSLDGRPRDMNRSAAFDPSGGDVIAFAHSERAAGRQAAIATLVAIEGSAPRGPGAQMAVAADGRFAGSISSGCLERAIVDEARAAMAQQEGRIVRYGKGSRFLDIVLPCGSGLDVLYTINPAAAPLRGALDAQAARRVCALEFRAGGVRQSDETRAGWREGVFTRIYRPPLRIVAAGAGAELIVLSRIASAAGYAVCAASPDAETLTHCVADEKVRLQSVSSPPTIALDPCSAFIFLFHDRDWELALARSVLASPAFYVGAVGGRKTAASRLEALRGLGLEEAAIKRLEGPAGLIPRVRDPCALAISVLAGVVAAWPR